MEQNLVFSSDSKKLIYAGSSGVTVGFGTEAVVWTTLNEEYDPLYNYTYDENTLIASNTRATNSTEIHVSHTYFTDP